MRQYCYSVHSVSRMSEEEGERKETCSPIEDDVKLRSERRKSKRKKQLMKEAEKADKRGVCYLSHIPPKMDPLKLRQLLSQYGEIQRIYLTPESNLLPLLFKILILLIHNFVSNPNFLLLWFLRIVKKEWLQEF